MINVLSNHLANSANLGGDKYVLPLQPAGVEPFFKHITDDMLIFISCCCVDVSESSFKSRIHSIFELFIKGLKKRSWNLTVTAS